MTALVTAPLDIPEDFGFTEEHALLGASARRLLAEKCPMTAVRRLADDPVGFDPALFRQLGELGWTGLLLPEQYGGAGLDFLSMALVLQEAGRCLLPGPLLPHVLAGLAVELGGKAEHHERHLPALASGERMATVAFSEPGGSWAPDAVTAAARTTASGDGYELDGIKAHVPWAASAALMIAPFRVDGGDIALFAVDLAGPGIHIEPEAGIDPTRRMARVRFEAARVGCSARLGRGELAVWRTVHRIGYALLAAEMVGAADAILARTCEYATQRVQFDRPIGAFQAVKHPLVDVLVAVERARSLMVGAAAALDARSERAEILTHMAKAAATDALGFAADRGVQLHGGFGFTWDCDAHFYMKRALWSAATLGNAAYHRRCLGRLLGQSQLMGNS